MKTLEWLPKQSEWLIKPNQMIPDSGYMCGKMSVNWVSTILGHVGVVTQNWIGRSYT